jgi:L-2-hydroxyglutarate oxidase
VGRRPTTYDVVVIGAGIVGLATALRILERRPGTRLLVVEKEAQIAQHQTGHNSGVVHSGLYYRPGSLKAKNCREGYERLLEFCRSERIAHQVCGKIVVAVDESDLGPLDELYRRGTANGLTGLRYLAAEEIREVEPHCTGIRGLFVPQAGIVDYQAVSEKYADRVRALGGEIALGERVDEIRRANSALELATPSATRRCRVLAACAGLHSDRLARQTRPDLPLRITPFRGEYYVLKPEVRGLVRNLIYPVPDPAFPFLGVHFTRRIDGSVECGPNAVLAFKREGYKRTAFSFRDTWETLAWPGFRIAARKHWRAGFGEFHRSFSKPAFVHALQRLIPEIRAEHLDPGGVGVRAQACSIDGRLLDDFRIVEDGNVLHVCNAPSPAATASLAIGAVVADAIVRKLR